MKETFKHVVYFRTVALTNKTVRQRNFVCLFFYLFAKVWVGGRTKSPELIPRKDPLLDIKSGHKNRLAEKSRQLTEERRDSATRSTLQKTTASATELACVRSGRVGTNLAVLGRCKDVHGCKIEITKVCLIVISPFSVFSDRNGTLRANLISTVS